jgi:hypothetical protein
MTDKQDLAPVKIRLKDNYRERIFAESQQLGKSYLETLYFIIDCYFVFIKGGLPAQQAVFTPINTESNKQDQPNPQPSPDPKPEDPDDETFSLDFEL